MCFWRGKSTEIAYLKMNKALLQKFKEQPGTSNALLPSLHKRGVIQITYYLQNNNQDLTFFYST